MRKHFSGIWFLLLLLIGIQGCTLDTGIDPSQIAIADQGYRFFVAGHSYGHPIEATDSLGVYPPFYRKYPDFAADPLMEFGVLTGDIVKWNQQYRFDSVKQQIARYGLEVYKIPGNHDVDGGIDYDNFHANFGPSWYSHRIHNDLFLFLDPNIDNWNITDPQLAMMRDELLDLDEVRNIFVFSHQVLWWSPEPDSAFNDFDANSPFGRADEINFWTEVLPPFLDLEQEVWFFAGDAGAWCWTDAVRYYQSNNIHFATSGMGCPTKSNYLEVTVNPNREVNVRIVALLPEGEDALGTLEDWRIVP